MLLPNREKLRTDIAEPKLLKSQMLAAEPRRPKPRRLKLLPRWKKSRIEALVAKTVVLESKSERELPNRATPRSDIEDPKLT
jgi:hypothetical protein